MNYKYLIIVLVLIGGITVTSSFADDTELTYDEIFKDDDFIEKLLYLLHHQILNLNGEADPVTTLEEIKKSYDDGYNVGKRSVTIEPVEDSYLSDKIIAQGSQIDLLKKQNKSLENENYKLKDYLQKEKQDMNPINEINDGGDFKLALRQTDTYYREYEILDARLTDEIDYLNKLLKLPHDISVIAQECQEVNAFYDYQSRTIIFCYELVNEFYNVFSNEEFFTDISQDSIYSQVNSNIIETLYHEVGHAMFMSWDIPFTGLEENVVDQFAVFLIWNNYDNESINLILYDIGSYYWVQDQYYLQDQSDVHSLDLQRFYNISCYVYGFDKDYNQDLITDEWLPLSRSYNCEYEFDRLLYGFSNVFENYFITFN